MQPITGQITGTSGAPRVPEADVAGAITYLRCTKIRRVGRLASVESRSREGRGSRAS